MKKQITIKERGAFRAPRFVLFVFFDHPKYLFLWMQTDHLSCGNAVFEENQCRNTRDSEIHREGDLGVDVDFREKHALFLTLELLKDRREHPAGGAPVGMKIEHDQPRVGAYGIFQLISS